MQSHDNTHQATENAVEILFGKILNFEIVYFVCFYHKTQLQYWVSRENKTIRIREVIEQLVP
jgi:mannose/fructose-specific phosphotransferase system component IIA